MTTTNLTRRSRPDRERHARSRVGLVTFAVVALSAMMMVPAPAAAAHPTFDEGDVFVSVGNGRVHWYHPDGTLNAVLDTTLGGFTTGSAFDAAGNLYVTGFGAQAVSVFDPTGALVGTFGSGYNSNPESILFNAAGEVYVGHADGARDIRKFADDGTFLQAFNVATEARGSDWIDLAADQCTMFYTSEHSSVLRYDVCTDTQLPDFAGGLPRPCFALRLLSDGGLLVACSSQVFRLDSGGSVVQTYDKAGQNNWFALNLDPDGTSFWSADSGTAEVVKFDIDSGAELLSFNTGTGPSTVFGLSVKGEITEAVPPETADCGPMDVAFVVDDTGSMGGEIDNVKAGLNDIVNQINAASGGDFQLGLVTFKDTVEVDVDLVDTDGSQVGPAINALSAIGGNFFPEASDEALNTTVNALAAADRDPFQQTGDFSDNWRSGAVKIAIIVTDALPGGFDDTFTSGVDDVHAHKVALDALARNIKISAIATTTHTGVVAIMQDYADTTGGVFVQAGADGSETSTAIESIIAECGGEPQNLQVTKTANPAFDREVFWDIDKSVDNASHDLDFLASGTSTYTVTVNQTGFEDFNHSVAGTITVVNPSDELTAEVASVEDAVSGVGQAAVDCGVAFPHTLGPGETLVCTYETALPDGATRTNTAWANVTADSEMLNGTGSAEVNFTGVDPTTTVNGEVNVDDTHDDGDFGPINGTTTHTYTRIFTCGRGDGQFTGEGNVVDNTATIVETNQSDDATVRIDCEVVETVTSCTAYALGLEVSPQWAPPLGYDQVLAESSADATQRSTTGHGDAQEAGADIVLPGTLGAISASELGSTCDASVAGGPTMAEGTAYVDPLEVDLDIPGADADGTPGIQLELSADVLLEEGMSADNVGSNTANIVTVTGTVESIPFVAQVGPAPANYKVPISAGGTDVGFLVLNEQTTAAGTCGTQFSGNALRLAVYDLDLTGPATDPPETMLELTVGHVTTMTCPDHDDPEPVGAPLATCDAFGLDIDVSPIDVAPTGATSTFSHATSGVAQPFGMANGSAVQVGLDGVAPAGLSGSTLSAEAVEAACSSSYLGLAKEADATAAVKDLDLVLDVPGATLDATPGIQVSLTSDLLHAETRVVDGVAVQDALVANVELLVEGTPVHVHGFVAPNTHIHINVGAIPVGVLWLNEQVPAAAPCGEVVTNALRLVINDPVGQPTDALEVTAGHAAASTCGNGAGAGGGAGGGAGAAPADAVDPAPAGLSVDDATVEAPRAADARDPVAALLFEMFGWG